MIAEQAHTLDRDPTVDATAEWLVISAGADNAPAADAVKQARQRGMRVNHLMLAELPAQEALIVRTAAGAKHIVVSGPEQLAADVRRMLPLIGIVPASGAELTLQRLLYTPRCC
jgi:hypothetical protein